MLLEQARDTRHVSAPAPMSGINNRPATIPAHPSGSPLDRESGSGPYNTIYG